MSLEKFTNLYSLSKTIRFELKPIGKTLENIEKNGIIMQDELRADEYKKVKKIIDEYHKRFIEESLKNFSFAENSLEEYKNAEQKDAVETKLRKQIADKFTKSAEYSKVSKEGEGIKAVLEFVENDIDKKKLVEEFNRFTTYFGGFYENRKNMYSDEEKSTAIAYRLINDNLPKFIGNISVFDKIKDKLQDKFDTLKKELELPEDLEYYFNLGNYNKFLTQSEIDLFNTIIGGKVTQDGDKKKGLNEYINLYNQNQADKKEKLPKFTHLFKMILSDKITLSWLPEQFENDNEVLNAINGFYLSVAEEKQENGQIVFEQLKSLLQEIKPNLFDFDKIYLRNDKSLTDISQKFLGHWSEIQNAIEKKYEETHPKSKRKSQEKYDEEKEKFFKRFDSISLKFINECTKKNIEDYFAGFGEEKDENGQIVKENLFETIEKNYNAVKTLLNIDYPSDKELSQDKDNVSKIKNFLDGIMDLFHFIKPLYGKGNETDKDEKFYGEFLNLFEKLKVITKLYDKTRNYVTKKPYSTEKIKLNFENSTLCNGWDVNKEQDNTAILLRKGESFYLAVMNYRQKTKFNDAETAKDGEIFYEKMDYKLLPGPNKMLPKVFFSEKGLAKFNPSNEILEIYRNGCHKKGDTFDKNKMYKLIDFFKDSIAKHEDWKNFGFKFSDTSSYEIIDKFYNEVLEQGYKITFRKISEKYINKLVEENKLYLFQIYNKDFSEYSKGTKNMHTLYWKETFSEENLKNAVYKLNGEAEIFYRKKSINYGDDILRKGHHYEDLKDKIKDKKTGKFYPIIKDRRFAFDKFLFHCPITLNFKAAGNEYINENVNIFIKQNEIKHIIGIDRGERHLLYVSVIDLDGNIKKQVSLNEIINKYNGNEYKKDYHELLDIKEINRTEQRKEWQTIESIKEIKQGYLSQVVHKISELIVKYNAIVVLEDLNFGFIRGRQKIEKSVYQQFEKRLIDKLNYLVFKNKDKNDNGGTRNALQLTNKFKSFKEMGKQCGFLFYVAAWNTSKIDPITGFVNMFDCRYESVEKAKMFFNKFCDIRFNKEKNYFEFIVDDYTKFNVKTAETRQNWIICTNGERIKTFRNSDKNNNWDNEEVTLSKEFKKLFCEYEIDFNSDLKAKILANSEKEFFEKLLWLFKLTVQMRNSITGTDIDYMISPVANKNGEFFYSVNEVKKGKDEHGNWISDLPMDADANGAYNIARKGLMVIDKIKNSAELKKIDLVITNKEWLKFAQKEQTDRMSQLLRNS